MSATLETATQTRTSEPGLVFFYSGLSGRCRRVEGYPAQVLQHRGNHDTFKLYRVQVEDNSELVRRLSVQTYPTLVVFEGKHVRARLEQPRGCRDIEAFLAPWLR